MRRFASIFLIFMVGFACVLPGSIAAKTLQQSQVAAITLTTDEVLALVKSGLAPEVITAKLERTKCICDVSPTEIQLLKEKGVPDEILLAMVNATKLASSEPRAIKIPKDTSVEIEAAYRINSQEITAGEAITFRVVDPIILDNTTVIAVDSIATGRIVKASRGAHWGRAGRLTWVVENVLAVDGTKVPIHAEGHTVGDSKGAKVATQIVITGALLGPFAPIALLHGFKRGENAYIPQGRRFRAIVSADTIVKSDR